MTVSANSTYTITIGIADLPALYLKNVIAAGWDLSDAPEYLSVYKSEPTTTHVEANGWTISVRNSDSSDHPISFTFVGELAA